MEIYDTITLPNGGHVVLDKLAYESYTGCGQSTHKYEWKYTIEFEGGNVVRTSDATRDIYHTQCENTCVSRNLTDVIETAAMDINKYNLEVR